MILTSDEIQELQRLSRGILQVQELIDRVNEAAAATGLQLRPILPSRLRHSRYLHEIHTQR
jgi:hypothetical protein